MTDLAINQTGPAPEKSGGKPAESQTIVRNCRGQFVRGARSANPKGKPRGPHRATLVAQSLLGQNARELLEVAIDQAKQPRGGAMLRAILPLIISPLKERPVQFDIGPLETPTDGIRAIQTIAEGVATGALTESQGTMLTKLVETFNSSIKTVDIDERLKILEQKLKESK